MLRPLLLNYNFSVFYCWYGLFCWHNSIVNIIFPGDENESCSDESIIAGPSHLRDVTIAERAGEGAPLSGEAVLAENAQE
ncbi:unnamed protein product, partial [Brenthis ino]